MIILERVDTTFIPVIKYDIERKSGIYVVKRFL